MLTPLTRTFVAGKTPRSWISYARVVGNVGNEPVAADTAKKQKKDEISYHCDSGWWWEMNLLNCNVLPVTV
jgi:hypothetical protein